MLSINSLSESAREFLNLKDYKSMMEYFDSVKNKPSKNDFSSVDPYIRYCDISELPKYINHPSPRIKEMIEKRLNGE